MTRSTHRLCVVLALLLSSLAGAQSYTVTDLGVLSAGGYSYGIAINDSGEVVGQAGAVPSLGFVWSASSGIQTLPPFARNSSTLGRGINASGVVAGQSSLLLGGLTYFHAVTWTDGTIRDLGTLAKQGISAANAVNASGQVAGSSSTPNGQAHATFWSESTGLEDLGTFPGGDHSLAYAINQGGQIAGNSNTPGGTVFAFVWTKATGLHNLGTLRGGTFGSSAFAMNDLGQIVGESSCSNNSLHPALWSPKAKVQDLGLVPGTSSGSAYGINNQGQVVGIVSYTNGTNHAFVWKQSAGIQDLNNLIPANSGWLLEQALAINNGGQITGQGTINGEIHGFLLTPNSGALRVPIMVFLRVAERILF